MGKSQKRRGQKNVMWEQRKSTKRERMENTEEKCGKEIGRLKKKEGEHLQREKA